MVWTFNGVLVTGTARVWMVKTGVRYRGVAYGKPWPLAVSGSSACREILELERRVQELTLYTQIKRTDGLPSVPVVDDLSFHLAVVSDMELVRDYVNRCVACGMPIRTLLCATTCSYPRMDTEQADLLIDHSQFLGYDYVSHDCAFSALNEDLFNIASPESECPSWLDKSLFSDVRERLGHHSLLLNASGLFDKSSDLEAYISERWGIARETIGKSDEHCHVSLLEESVELWPCGVHEIAGLI